MNKVLIINPYYFPGYKSGGPQQTVMNIVEAYGNQFDFYILTLNHDLGETKKYDSIHDGWNNVGNAHVKYLEEKDFNYKNIAKYSNHMNIIYACGLFEKTTIQAMIANKKQLFNCPFFIAPMGVFSKGAFKQKKLKKMSFIYLCRILHLFKNITWSLTSELEVNDFKKVMGNKKYVIATDIPKKPIEKIVVKKKKNKGEIRIIFLSRICITKNLKQAIDIIYNLKGNIIFDIYGTIEDQNYWDSCKKKLEDFPSNIHWQYKGEINNNKVIDTFENYDLFLFPTYGENFGHVIYESFLGGCIPIISNTTPWRNLKKEKCGVDLPLNREDLFIDEVQTFVDMEDGEISSWYNSSYKYALDTYRQIVSTNNYKKIFNCNQ